MKARIEKRAPLPLDPADAAISMRLSPDLWQPLRRQTRLISSMAAIVPRSFSPTAPSTIVRTLSVEVLNVKEDLGSNVFYEYNSYTHVAQLHYTLC